MKAPPVQFKAKDKTKKNSGKYAEEAARKMLEPKAPQTLTLKVGAQVMCLKNYPAENLVNGSR